MKYNTIEFSHFMCQFEFYWLYSHVTSTIIKVCHLKNFLVFFPRQPQLCFLSLWFCFFRISYKWNLVVFCAWFLLLSIMVLRLIYLYVSVVFPNCWVVVHIVTIAQFGSLSTSWWMFGFQFLSVWIVVLCTFVHRSLYGHILFLFNI